MRHVSIPKNGGQTMGNYIAFFDLLGIKAIESYNSELYFDNIKSFQYVLKECSNILSTTKYQIRAFSDCAYVECNDIGLLFEYLISLRETLFLKQIFFNAAVTEGTLDSPTHIENNDNIVCISFKSHETVKVYSMQTAFSGVGIYIDPNVYAKLSQTLRDKYTIKSAYCVYDKEESYNKFELYCDLKYNDITPHHIKFLLMNYLKTIALNKKASRYYLSAILTCINQISFENLTKQYLDLFLNVDIRSMNKTIFHDLLPIHLMLINRLYDSYNELTPCKGLNPNHNLEEYLDKITKNSPLHEGFDNLQFYSDRLLSKENKYQFTDYISKKIVEKLSTRH